MKEKESEEGLQEFLSESTDFDFNRFEEQLQNNAALHSLLCDLDKLCHHVLMPYKEEIWNRIHIRLKKRKRRRLWMRSVAAAMILFFIGTSVLYLERKKLELPESTIALEKQQAQQVQLFLTEGKVVNLTTLRKDTLIRENGTDIEVNSQNGLIYLPEQIQEETSLYHILRVPRGCEYHLILADTTEVWLNSESELRFPVNFVGGERKVHLKGEAYFKVTRDSLCPFRVLAEEMLVEVLGTSFNVNTYRDNGALQTTLVEGRVVVKDTISGSRHLLKPYQQIELQNGKGVVKEVCIDEVINWKEGRFLFRDMPLEQIARHLERWYDVQIIFQEENLRKQRFTGIIKRYNTLTEVCAMIEETGKVKFEINSKEIRICYKK